MIGQLPRRGIEGGGQGGHTSRHSPLYAHQRRPPGGATPQTCGPAALQAAGPRVPAARPGGRLASPPGAAAAPCRPGRQRPCWHEVQTLSPCSCSHSTAFTLPPALCPPRPCAGRRREASKGAHRKAAAAFHRMACRRRACASSTASCQADQHACSRSWLRSCRRTPTCPGPGARVRIGRIHLCVCRCPAGQEGRAGRACGKNPQAGHLPRPATSSQPC